VTPTIVQFILTFILAVAIGLFLVISIGLIFGLEAIQKAIDSINDLFDRR